MTHDTPTHPQGDLTAESLRDHDPGAQAVDRRFASDCEALRATTLRNLPTMDDTVRAVASRRPPTTSEAYIMSTLRSITGRPWLTTGLAAAATAVALLFVPVTYTRTTGYDVAVTFGDAQVAPQTLAKVATELRKALQASNVTYQSGERSSVVAQVPLRSRAEIAATAAAFTRELAGKGVQATSSITPRIEHVTGNAYAAAAGKVVEIRVNATGKSDAEIEADIRSQLAAEGFTASEVSVTTREGERQLQIQMHKPDDGSSEPIDDVNVQLEDANKSGEAKTAKVKLDHASLEGKTDAEIAALVTEQLRQQGVEAEVTVANGEVVSIKTIKK